MARTKNIGRRPPPTASSRRERQLKRQVEAEQQQQADIEQQEKPQHNQHELPDPNEQEQPHTEQHEQPTPEQPDQPQTEHQSAHSPRQPSDPSQDAVSSDEDVVSTRQIVERIPRKQLLSSPFPGGPTDVHVLKRFMGHTAVHIWHEERDRPLLKTVLHGSKLQLMQYDAIPEQVREIVNRSGLIQLLSLRYHLADQALVSAFVERWHPDTNTFHLPVGEMTILLDDVASLLHLPISGAFVSPPKLSKSEGKRVLHELLGLPHEEASEEIEANNTATIRLQVEITLSNLEASKCIAMEDNMFG